MQVCLTGATGFIGGHLLRCLVGAGHAAGVIVRHGDDAANFEAMGHRTHVDDGDMDSLTHFLAVNAFDGVIHLATRYVVAHTPSDVPSLIDANVLFGARMIEAASQAGIPWFLDTGTSFQYRNGIEGSPVNLYAATKSALQAIGRYYVDAGRIRSAVLFLSDTYGPDDRRPKLFNLWHKIALSGESLDMSPGDQVVDILHVQDVTDGFLRLAELLQAGLPGHANGAVFALHSQEPMSLRRLAVIFQEAVGRKLHINWGARPYRERECMVPWTGGTPVPGWQQSIPLAHGIAALFAAAGTTEPTDADD